MKIMSTLTAAALLAAALLQPAALRAEDKAEGAKSGKEAFMERMKEKFGISDEQEAKLKTAKRARRDADAAIHQEIQASMRKLSDQLEDKAPEKDLSATLDKIVASRKSLRAEEDKFESTLSSILTPTQRAKMLLAMKGHGMRGGKMGGGMPGKPPHKD